jgi:hypothetical protein
MNSDRNPELHVFENGSYRIDAFGKKSTVEVKDLPAPVTLDKAWKVQFDATYGFDKTLDFDQLTDWKDHQLEAVRHYSGSAVYSTTFTMPKTASKQIVELDLGNVAVAATVTLNGEELGTVWKKPYRLDISDALRAGENRLSLKVANLWSNRLIGDEQYADKAGVIRQKVMPEWYTNNQPQPDSQRFSFCAFKFYEKDDSLLPSGLLGPVRLIVSKKISVR